MGWVNGGGRMQNKFDDSGKLVAMVKYNHDACAWTAIVGAFSVGLFDSAENAMKHVDRVQDEANARVSAAYGREVADGKHYVASNRLALIVCGTVFLLVAIALGTYIVIHAQ